MTTRERLLEVGGRLFAEHGYDGVSVRDLTREAKANLGAITYHFGSKDALFGEILLRKIEPLREIGRSVMRSSDPPEVRLRTLLSSYALHVLYGDPVLKVLFAEALSGGERLPKEAAEAVNERNEIFIKIVREGIEQGVFRECDLEVAAWSFFGMLSAYVLYEPLVPGKNRGAAFAREHVSRIVDASLDLFLNGLRRRS